MDTNEEYSAWDQLPQPEPKLTSYPANHFYEHTAKHLIKDTVRIMDNGLHMDLQAVMDLDSLLAGQLEGVDQSLADNKLIKQYLQQRYKKLVNLYIEDRKTKLRTPEQFLKEFKPNDPVHRSYFMYVYTQQRGMSQPTELLPTGIPKWSAKLVKSFAATNPVLQKLLAKEITPTHPTAIEAMDLLAEHKAELHNKKYLDQIANPDLELPRFNPSSPQQKQELFAMLKIESEAVSKTTGAPSFNRDQIERINKEYIDPDIVELTQRFIDHSFAAIVKNNFIKAFYTYTVDNRLYGQYKLLGAKSARYTSNSPNMLNMPSTKSIFAKPIKRCFTAPNGKIILTADYSALEDRVIASISRDINKCNVFLQNLDGHCLNAYGYFRDEIAEYMELTGDTVTDVTRFFELTKTTPELDDIRQKGKPATFGLSYGAFPPKVATSLKIPLNEAESIFNNYHTVLYPGITDYRENYVLQTAMEYGEVHLGLGFTMKTDNPSKDIRTLANGTIQFWSILTALTINKMHQLIDKAGYQDDIKVISTIYDSIYFEVTEDPEIIKWTNDNLIRCMSQNFMENQTIENAAESEIGYNWADLVPLKNNSDISSVNEAITKAKEKLCT